MPSTKSVIISCAGIGSRLGLATTKALIKINGKSLIRWQLELFKNIQDVRIVVGFQANDVIKEVSKYRDDVIFVYNHRYFETKTGASYYLGARDGNEYAIEYDGDLLVHPEDMNMLLEQEGEWAAYADKMSDDAIEVKVNEVGDVLGFHKPEVELNILGGGSELLEWTGPCCLKKDKIKYTADNVYNQLEPYLPMKGIKIRACDIDTYDDYQRAIEFIKGW